MPDFATIGENVLTTMRECLRARVKPAPADLAAVKREEQFGKARGKPQFR